MKKGNPSQQQQAAGELKIKAALREKDVLIKGINHRFINHLNLIYNILYFQRQYNKDSRCNDILESIQKQIKSIALVHEYLHPSMDFNQVRFAAYLKSLLRETTKAAERANKKVIFKTRIDPVAVDLTTAITCGLIINELLDNSLKHAFPDQCRAEIFVGLKDQKDGTVALTVSDNGIGLPPEVQWHMSGTMGSFLVNTLTENLKGELTVNGNDGTSFRLRFSPFPQ
jgi:two-component sensor histidine kinase